MDGYYAWMIVATAFVLMMTTPALALFYGGMTRSKSVLNMMMMSFLSMAIVGIVMMLWGWSEGWGKGYMSGDLDGKLIANPFTLFGLKGVDWHSTGADTGSWYIAIAFQMTFAVITAALISGAIADRVKVSSWAVFLPIWVTLCYFPVVHNVWGGGWLSSHWTVLDYAGGTVVHINAGIAGGVLALIIGRRVGFRRDPMRPHNLTLTMIGAGLLWMGWYGFNVGSIVFTGSTAKQDTAQFMSETGVTFMNTTLATMAAMLCWLIVERIMHGKASALGAASGIVAGLVAITPACGAVGQWGAIVVGGVAGILCALAVNLKYVLNLDDSLDVVGVHLVGGIVGALMIGLVGTAQAPAGADGLLQGGGWTVPGHQCLGVLFTIVWTGVLTTVIGLAIKYTIGWRVGEDAEVEGIDFHQHGESAYDIAPGTGVLG